MKEGFDMAMEMSGNLAALTDIFDNMYHGGKIAILGIMPDDASIDWNKLVFSMLTIKGIYGREMYETWYKITSMIQTGLDISPLITHKFHYTEFEKGFDVMRSGQSGKVILDHVNNIACVINVNLKTHSFYAVFLDMIAVVIAVKFDHVFGKLKDGQKLPEESTTNSWPTSYLNYYFI